MSADPLRTDALMALAQTLRRENRPAHAVTILEHLNALRPRHAPPLLALAAAYQEAGRTTDALAALTLARQMGADPAGVAEAAGRLAAPAGALYDARIAAGDLAGAEAAASAMADLAGGGPMLALALACNVALGRQDRALACAQALLAADPANGQAHAALADIARALGQVGPEIHHRRMAAAAPGGVAPLIRLRDLHDAMSLVLTRLPTDAESDAALVRMRADALALPVPAASAEEEAWERHYRLLVLAMDAAAAAGPTPAPPPLAAHEAATSAGDAVTMGAVRAAARSGGARCVFFVAADEAYVDLYARWFALSVRKHADVAFLAVVHVIGGRGRLGPIARRVGVDDPRLFFTADAFDRAGAQAVGCWDAPPKGRAALPLAHYQCQRFLRAEGVLSALKLPLFISDIDLLLQRGVADLLDRTADADVTLNENHASRAAGSRLTANLLLLNPTPAAHTFARFLAGYLDAALKGPEVTRWIDQAGLVMARRHLHHHAPDARVAYFDTDSDINNLMYARYQDNPYRFFSLFHGFDTSSLEDSLVT